MLSDFSSLNAGIYSEGFEILLYHRAKQVSCSGLALGGVCNQCDFLLDNRDMLTITNLKEGTWIAL